MLKDNDPAIWMKLLTETAGSLDKTVRFMEVCGTHTMALFETGLREALPENIQMLSGPGCPVCVTPDGYIDAAINLAENEDVILTTFGDMIRVPGQNGSLQELKSRGKRVEIVYSPLASVDLAKSTPDKSVVFLAVGFETTVPAIATAIKTAESENVTNFSILCAHKTVPQALEAVVSGGARIDGLMCPGHVSVIIGSNAYNDVVEKHSLPCVVSGFEAIDMIRALIMLIKQIHAGIPKVENAYLRAVHPNGNPKAQALISEVFRPCDAEWRGLGVIPQSGLELREEYHAFDACHRFGIIIPQSPPHKSCRCGEILQGIASPYECKLFGTGCTPETPYGPCMVSSEGTCAAHYKYGKHSKY